MKILVLNCGSSSIKYALYNMDDKSVMTSGGAERVGLDGAFVKVKMPDGTKKTVMHNIPEHTEARNSTRAWCSTTKCSTCSSR